MIYRIYFSSLVSIIAMCDCDVGDTSLPQSVIRMMMMMMRVVVCRLSSRPKCQYVIQYQTKTVASVRVFHQSEEVKDPRQVEGRRADGQGLIESSFIKFRLQASVMRDIPLEANLVKVLMADDPFGL